MNQNRSIPDLGREVEDVVEKLCSDAFSPDLIVRSPKYKKAGIEKEAADILVTLGQTSLVIQVKTRILPPGNEVDLGEVETARFTRMIGKALDQFRALLEAINAPGFGAFLNVRGLPINFEKTQKRTVLMVIYAVVLSDGTRPDFKLQLTKSCQTDYALSIHLFSLEKFEILTRFLNTFPDFLNFLQLREDLQAVGLIDQMADPVDVWALVNFEKAQVTAAIASKIPPKIDGLWLRHQESLERLDKLEQPGYFVDWLIAGLHANSGNVGTVHPYIANSPRLEEKPGSLEAFQRTAPYLAKLNRRERAELTEQLFIRIERSQDGMDSFGGVRFEKQEDAYFVMSCIGSRADRQLALHNLGCGLACKLKVGRVVCIGTGPKGPMDDGCDVIVVENETGEFSEEIKKLADSCFGTAREERRPA
jgi:hypothetical protein